MKKNINNTGEIGKSKRYPSLFSFFVWFQLFLLVFQEATLKLSKRSRVLVVFLPKDTRHQPRLSGSCHCRCAGMMWCSVL